MPKATDGRPLIYKTVYRPSSDYPNSIVYMALFDLKRVKTRLFIGNTEPGISLISNPAMNENLSRIVAITNAMWMQQHARARGPYSEARWSIPWSQVWLRSWCTRTTLWTWLNGQTRFL